MWTLDESTKVLGDFYKTRALEKPIKAKANSKYPVAEFSSLMDSDTDSLLIALMW